MGAVDTGRGDPSSDYHCHQAELQVDHITTVPVWSDVTVVMLVSARCDSQDVLLSQCPLTSDRPGRDCSDAV